MATRESDAERTTWLQHCKLFGLTLQRRTVLAWGSLTGKFDKPPSASPWFDAALNRLDVAIAELAPISPAADVESIEARLRVRERQVVLLRQAAKMLRREVA